VLRKLFVLGISVGVATGSAFLVQMEVASATPRSANTTGVYSGTSTGAPSLNGHTPTKSKKPCAGCVGNADQKNPPGQLPDAVRDGNNGYECDGNRGIALGNPAHSGCIVTKPTPSTVVVGNT
jgi:hypothetical protein